MIRCPDYLDGEAKKYWQKHAKRLADAGLLTEADTESFALLCEIWGLIRQCKPMQDSKEAIRYIALTKQMQAIGRQYGMFAKDRIKSKISEEKEVTDEFGL